MTVVSIRMGTEEDLRRVELSDGSLFSFRLRHLPPELLNELDFIDPSESRELSETEEEVLLFARDCFLAEKVALQLIARAEQTVFGLGMKLKKRGHGSACMKAVVSGLCEVGLLDDLRYAGLWLESRIAGRSSSPRRLIASLCAKGIDRDDAETALGEALYDEAEERLLERFVQRYQGGYSELLLEDESERRSLKHTLKGEGFSASAIRKFLGE